MSDLIHLGDRSTFQFTANRAFMAANFIGICKALPAARNAAILPRSNAVRCLNMRFFVSDWIGARDKPSV